MAIVTRAGNGKFYMVYEMVGMPGHALEPRANLVHFRVSDDGDNWGDFRQYGTLIQDRWRQFPWATPSTLPHLRPNPPCCPNGP